MKIILTLMLAAIAIPVLAQSDAFDSTEYINGLPVTNDDTVRRPFPDRPPKDVWIAVPESEIPSRLKRSLDKNEIYEGWRRRGVFRDRNTGLYIISVGDKSSTRTFGLNERGKPVTFDEYSPPADSIE